MLVERRINVTPFDNGVHLYSMASSIMNLSAIGFRSGSINDPPGMSGMNHLVEHLTCRRSTKYSERDVERVMNRYMGGTHGDGINVRCDRSSVLYGHDDLRRREYMWKCFDMFASLVKDTMLDAYGMGPRVLDSAALKVEQAAIHNEYRVNGTDVAEEHLYDLVYWNLYKRNPARQRIDCAPSDLRNFKLRQVKNFIRERYTTGNMFVILVGPNNNEAVEKVREYFGDLPHHSTAPLDYDLSDNFPVLNGISAFEMVRPGIRQHHIAVGFPANPYPKDVEVLEILATLWEARIERRLREENLNFNSGIYHPNVYYPQTVTQGLIMAMFPTVGDSKYVEHAIEVAIDECEKIKSDESISFAEDCEDMRLNLYDAFHEMLSYYPMTLSERITEATCNGDYNLKHFFTYPKRIKRVTPRQVRDAARKYFTSPDRFIRVVIKPLTVPREIINRSSEEVKPYLLALNYDQNFSTKT